MKARNLLILAVLAAALAFWTYRTHTQKQRAAPPAMGSKVLPNLPVNEIGKIVITSPGSTTIVAKIKEKWSVSSRYNYPAHFGKIADTIRLLADMTVGQVVNISGNDLEQLDLLKPGETEAGTTQGGVGTLVEFMDDHEQIIDYLVIGKSFIRQPSREGQWNGFTDFGGYPDGQYIRTRDNKVFLVSHNLGQIKEDVKTWLDDEFINVSDSDIVKITSTGPDREPLRLQREEQGEMALDGLDAAVETLDVSRANQMAGALRYLSFDDVAPPTLSLDQIGMDNPVIFSARTRDGQVYTIELGKESEDASFRYARVRVEYQEPEPAADEENAGDAQPTGEQAVYDKELAEKTKALNDKLSRWVYMMRPFRTTPMLLRREDIVSKQEQEKRGQEAEPEQERANEEGTE